MRHKPIGKATYRHDQNGYIAQEPGETVDARFMHHADILWIERMTRNPPRIVFMNSAPSGPTNPPIIYPVPIVQDINPRDINKGTGTFPLVVSGSGFTPQSIIVFGVATPAVTYTNANELKANAAPLQSTSGGVDVTVRQPDGQISNSKRFVFR